jgi:hypothetical protein
MARREWNGTCQRCGKQSTVHIMSMFNTDLICPACKEAERNEPGYAAAVQAEAEACKRGDYNFPGVGRGGRRR